jgi:polyphosphate kinase 2
MAKQHKRRQDQARKLELDELHNGDYEEQLHGLMLELVALQRHNIRTDRRIVVVLEGRDAAGKDGLIRTMTLHLSPRETRVVALGKPTDRDRSSWYFQRYVAHLPAADEFVLFNRSWYNRAGVERVMGFAEELEVQRFLQAAPVFERLLVDSGIVLFKYYLDITRTEQAKRLKARREDPLKQWKISPIDAVALKRFDDYTRARDEMLERTHTEHAPWTVVRADVKKLARLEVIRHLLSKLEYAGKGQGVRAGRRRKSAELLTPDPRVARDYEPGLVKGGFLAR